MRVNLHSGPGFRPLSAEGTEVFIPPRPLCGSAGPRPYLSSSNPGLWVLSRPRHNYPPRPEGPRRFLLLSLSLFHSSHCSFFLLHNLNHQLFLLAVIIKSRVNLQCELCVQHGTLSLLPFLPSLPIDGAKLKTLIFLFSATERKKKREDEKKAKLEALQGFGEEGYVEGEGGPRHSFMMDLHLYAHPPALSLSLTPPTFTKGPTEVPPSLPGHKGPLGFYVIS